MAELAVSCIREMKLPEKIRNDYSINNGRSFLESVSRLNVFIGPNNGGKSRLLRSLFEDAEGLFSAGLRPEESVRQARFDATRAMAEIIPFVRDHGDLAEGVRQIAPHIHPLWRKWRPDRYREHAGEKPKVNIDHFCERAVSWLASASMPRPDAQRCMSAIRTYFVRSESPSNENAEKLEFHRVYIPSFRSLHHLESEELEIPSFPARSFVPTFVNTRGTADHGKDLPVHPRSQSPNLENFRQPLIFTMRNGRYVRVEVEYRK